MPKARSRSREDETLDEAPRISLRVLSNLSSSGSSSLSSVITALARISACPSATATFERTSASVVNVKARGGTTSQGTRRGAVIRCLTLRRQVVAAARRQSGRSRVNRTGNVDCSNASKQRGIATPSDCTCIKAIDNVAADKTTGSRRACRKVSLLTRMRDIDSAADETIRR